MRIHGATRCRGPGSANWRRAGRGAGALVRRLRVLVWFSCGKPSVSARGQSGAGAFVLCDAS